MPLRYSKTGASLSKSDRRDATRVPVDAIVDYRPVGTTRFRRCSVLEVSTKAMKIVLDRLLPVDMVVNLAVPDFQGRGVHRCYGSVLRTEPSGNDWIHVVRAASHRPWPSTIIIDVLCSAIDYQKCESADGTGSAMRATWMSDVQISRDARAFISGGTP